MAINVHVVPEDGRWAVKCEGHPHEAAHHPTQHEAINAARALAEETHSELVIHGADGVIRQKWSCGNDPRNIPG